MRVLLVHNQYREPGGEDTVVRNDVSLLREAGHHVEVHDAQNPAGPAAAGRLAMSAWNPWSRADFSRIVRAARPDVVHVHNVWFDLSASILGVPHDHGVPLVATLHNYRLMCLNASLYRDGSRCTDCVGRGIGQGIVHRCYRGSMLPTVAAAAATTLHRRRRTWSRDVDVLLVPSSWAGALVRRAAVTTAPIVVRPHYVPDPGPRMALPSAARTVVYAGRLEREKGVESLIAGWAAAGEMGLELLIVGDGALRPLVLAAGTGVRWLPWMAPDELRRLFLQARAVVVPTRMYETFGLVAAEAMAAGTPVLTTAGGALQEAVGAAGPAALSVTADARTWARSLLALADGSAVDAWGALGRRRFEQELAPRRSLAALEGAYDRARSTRG